MRIIISSFDMGVRNFAFCVQEVVFSDLQQIKKIKSTFNEDGTPSDSYNEYLCQIYKTGKIIECKNIDLQTISERECDGNLFLSLSSILDKYIYLWDKTNVFLIEQQMSYGRNKSNIQALKLAQHCHSYFYTTYGNFKVIMDYPSQNKTRLLGCNLEDRKKHKSRKKFSVELAQTILKCKHQEKDNFFKIKKKDDISDCLLMIETFKIKYL